MAKKITTFGKKKSKGDEAVESARNYVKRVGKERAEAKAVEVKTEKKTERKPTNTADYYRGKYSEKLIPVADRGSEVRTSFILEANVLYTESRTGKKGTWKKGQLILSFDDSSYGTMDGRRGFIRR